MRRVVLAVVLSHGCSIAWHDAHRHSPPVSTYDCPSYIRSALDSVAAGGFAVMAGGAYVHRDDADSAAFIWLVPAAVTALVFAGSATYGFIEPGRCRRAMARTPELAR
jgi:hypothetical protein